MADVSLCRHRLGLRITASAVAVALAFVASAACVAAAAQTPEQKACCASMADDCGRMAVEASCCTHEPQADQGVNAAKTTLSPVMRAVVVAILDSPALAASPALSVALHRDAQLKPPGAPPTYLLISTFRI